MRWRRLWQPRRGMFWMMLGFNALSSLCSFGMRTLPLNTVGLLLFAGVALLNVLFGLAAAWALLKMPTAAEEAEARRSAELAQGQAQAAGAGGGQAAG